MPFKGINDPELPKTIKDLPRAVRKRWVNVFNSVFNECMRKENKGFCQERAFKIAKNSIKDKIL